MFRIIAIAAAVVGLAGCYGVTDAPVSPLVVQLTDGQPADGQPPVVTDPTLPGVPTGPTGGDGQLPDGAGPVACRP